MKRVIVALRLHREPDLFAGRSRGIIPTIRSMFAGIQKRSDPENSLPIVGEDSNDEDKNTLLQLTPDENERAKVYVKTLTDELKVGQIEGTNILTVTVQDPDPELAVKVAYKIADVFIEENADLEIAGAEKSYENLRVSIQELKGTIAEQENAFIEEMRSSGLPLQEKGQDLAASRLAGMSETWIKAMESRRQLEARYSAAVSAGAHGQGMNIPDLYENKVFQDTMRLNTERRSKLQDQIRDIDKQIQEAETQRDELLVKYTPEYVKVQEKKQKIASLKIAREKTEKDVLKTIDLDQKKNREECGERVSGRLKIAAGRGEDAGSRCPSRV